MYRVLTGQRGRVWWCFVVIAKEHNVGVGRQLVKVREYLPSCDERGRPEARDVVSPE